MRYKDAKLTYDRMDVGTSFLGRLFQKEVCAYVGGL